MVVEEDIEGESSEEEYYFHVVSIVE